MSRSWLEDYLGRLESRGNRDMAESVKLTTGRFCSEFLDDFDYCSERSALLVGNVQAGKTGQMFGIISAAADRDFFVFVILTTDNVLLQQQTLERVRKDLPAMCICDEDDSVAFELNEGVLPAVVVLKKNASTLQRWEKTFLTSRVLDGNPLFILDDEADATSLNTKVNENDVSTINRHIDTIRKNAASTIYLQVTGTPQSIFLQTANSGWSPDYTLAFEPGPKYLGGNFFFPLNAPLSRSIGFTDNDANPIRTFVVRHLTASALSFRKGRTVSNALAHVSALTSGHDIVKKEIEAEIGKLRQDRTELEKLVGAEIDVIAQDAPQLKINRNEVVRAVVEDVLPIARIIVKNSKADDDQTFETGCNFIVGGNSLGRGVTFPKLNTVLYTRTTKRPQADTIWQHNRIFGYDRDPLLIKVYLPGHLWKLLADINEQNNSMYAQIRAGIDKVKVALPPGLSPTRRGVIDRESVRIIMGGANKYPDDVKNRSLKDLDDLLATCPDIGHKEVSLGTVSRILSHFLSNDDNFSVAQYKSIFEELLAENPSASAVLIVRRDRDVAKGTGALLSPNDWKLGESFPDRVVLTLYRVTGTKGWGGMPLWVPNVRLPENRVFFLMKDSV